MNSPNHPRSLGLTALLVLLTVTYLLGSVYLLLAWMGLQSYDPLIWQRGAMPFFALLFAFGGLSALTAMRWKKWGVYSLALTWVLTGAANLSFGIPEAQPQASISAFLAALVIIGFFLLLLPAWPSFD